MMGEAVGGSTDSNLIGNASGRPTAISAMTTGTSGARLARDAACPPEGRVQRPRRDVAPHIRFRSTAAVDDAHANAGRHLEAGGCVDGGNRGSAAPTCPRRQRVGGAGDCERQEQRHQLLPQLEEPVELPPRDLQHHAHVRHDSFPSGRLVSALEERAFSRPLQSASASRTVLT